LSIDRSAKRILSEAVTVWHFQDPWDEARTCSLMTKDRVQLGKWLGDAFAGASYARGGDGFVAEFTGGSLEVQGVHREPRGKELSLCVRVNFTREQDAHLVTRCTTAGALIYGLRAVYSDEGLQLLFELHTDWRPESLLLTTPLGLIEPGAWHDLIVTYDGPHLRFYVDGILVDEEWPIGSPQYRVDDHLLIGVGPGEQQASCEFNGMIDHIAIWDAALSDEEIVVLSGGAEQVEIRRSTVYGTEQPANLQYWKPAGHNTGVGDCMPFYHEGRFHLFYLFDRRAHRSKWGLGAHQWAHASTPDLIHWQHHPFAIQITEEWEGSICTGSTLYADGAYYCFYATRMPERSTQPLGVAISTDGIHFEKRPRLGFLSAPYDPRPARDPCVFLDEETGEFHMLVTTELQTPAVDGRGGCLAHLVSRDLLHWEQTDPFLVPGYADQPECADYFAWHGWYYLIFSSQGIARYRMSRSPYGPWRKPKFDQFDGAHVRVMKTAPFTGDRRIGVAFLSNGPYAGKAIFREIVQHADGTLGTRFPPEMVPQGCRIADCKVEALTEGVSFSDQRIRIQAIEGFGSAMVTDIPRNLFLEAVVKPEAGSASFGICVRGYGKHSGGCELRLEPNRQSVSLRCARKAVGHGGEHVAIDAVEGLDAPFSIQLVAQDDIIDVCIGQRRTLAVRLGTPPEGERLFFFVQNGEVTFDSIVIRQI
jgi:beta-fructofuranosidase